MANVIVGRSDLRIAGVDVLAQHGAAAVVGVGVAGGVKINDVIVVGHQVHVDGNFALVNPIHTGERGVVSIHHVGHSAAMERGVFTGTRQGQAVGAQLGTAFGADLCGRLTKVAHLAVVYRLIVLGAVALVELLQVHLHVVRDGRKFFKDLGSRGVEGFFGVRLVGLGGPVGQGVDVPRIAIADDHGMEAFGRHTQTNSG